MNSQIQPLRVYPELNDDNAQEVLLFLLGGGSVRKGQEVISTHPIQVKDNIYTPYQIGRPMGYQDMHHPICGCDELERLYKKNIQAASSFWRGLDGILGNLEESDALGALGKFGLGEMLFALGGFYVSPFGEDTQGVSQKVKSLVDRGAFVNQSKPLWPYFHGVAIGKQAKDVVSDLRALTIMAYTYLQRGESANYWLDIIRKYPQYADHAFRGLAFCDLDAAKKLLDNPDELKRLSINSDCAETNFNAADRHTRVIA